MTLHSMGIGALYRVAQILVAIRAQAKLYHVEAKFIFQNRRTPLCP